MCVHSVISDPAAPRTVARQAPLSMGFFNQESWSGLPFPSPGDLPKPAIEPTSLASPAMGGGFFTSASPENPKLPHALFQTKSGSLEKQRTSELSDLMA